MPDNELKNPKMKMCRTAAAGLAIFVLTIVSLFTPLTNLYLTVVGTFVSFSLAIISLFIITLAPAQMRGRALSYITLVLSMMFLFLLGVANVRCRMPSKQLCGTKLKGLGTALMVYQYDFEKLPDINNWQDELIENADSADNQFICPNSSCKGSSYAINKYAYDMSLDEWPKDLVVMFEAVPPSKDARNISGGPELVNIANHDYLGMNVLFGDGHSGFVSAKEITGLNWSTRSDFVFPSETASYIQLHGKDWKEERKNISGYLTIVILCLAILCAVTAIFFWRFLIAYISISVVAAIYWSGCINSLSDSKTATSVWFSMLVWIITCGIIHVILKRLKFKYQKAFSKNLPILIGLSIGMIIGMLWIIPAIMMVPTNTQRHLVGDIWLASIALSGLCGFWFGAFEGFVWKKLFVAKKSDASDSSDSSEKSDKESYGKKS